MPSYKKKKFNPAVERRDLLMKVFGTNDSKAEKEHLDNEIKQTEGRLVRAS